MDQQEQQLLKDVANGIEFARHAPCPALRIYQAPSVHISRNQFCFFLKPGATCAGTDLHGLLRLVFNKLRAHRIQIFEVIALPARVLDTDQVMMRHYGTLNNIAKHPIRHLSAKMLAAFRSTYGIDHREAAIIGGFEFLQLFPHFTATRLESMWEQLEQHRIGSGAFVARVHVNDVQIFLLNGFVPRLMEMYTREGNVLVVFSLGGDLDWSMARRDFVGASDPSKASLGSLRSELLKQGPHLGITDVRLGWNGAHLSSGPVEALAELIRFTSTVSSEPRRTHRDFQFGRKLERRFNPSDIAWLLENPNVGTDQELTSVFELTEGMNEEDAIDLLVDLRPRLDKRMRNLFRDPGFPVNPSPKSEAIGHE